MVTAIVFSALAAATVACVVVFFIKGIRVKAYFDLETATLIVDAFVFGNVHAFKYKAFECNGYMYGQLNSRELKRLSFSENKSKSKEKPEKKLEDEEKDGFKKKITDKIKVFINMFGAMSGIRLKTLRAYLTVGTGDGMQTAMTVSSIAALMGIIGVATEDKIKIKNADIAVYPNFRYENTVLTVDMDTGAGLAGILVKLTALKIKLSADKRKSRAEA